MMNPTALTAPRPDRPNPSDPPQALLPCWDQLPAARQRELALTLAGLLVKCLPGHLPTPSEVEHE